MTARPEDYGAQLSALLPPGKAWPRQRGTVLTALLEALGASGARVEERAAELLRESDARTTSELLAEFEAMLGLPDECIGPVGDDAGRRAAAVARLIQSGGSTPAFFEQVAAALGYDVTVREFDPFGPGSRAGDAVYNPGQPFRAGESGPGDSCDGRQDWQFAWMVETTGLTVQPIRADAFGPGDHILSWGNELLECTLQRLKPAHTLLAFRYTTTPVDDYSVLIVVIDDVGLERIALYGTGGGQPYARTPRMEQLAANGVTFTNGYASPICGVTRAMFNTGRRPHRTKFGSNLGGTDLDPLDPAEIMLHEMARDGRGQANVGRGYFGKYHLCIPIGYEQHMTAQATQRYVGSIGNIGSDPASGSINHFNWRRTVSTFSTTSTDLITSPPFDETTYSTSVFRAALLAWLNAQPLTKPTVTVFTPNAPHGPYTVPPQSCVSEETWTALQTAGVNAGDVVSVGSHGFDVANLVFDAGIEATDMEIGRVLDGMHPERLAKTLVIVVGDNGTPGDIIRPPYIAGHAKATPYQQGRRVPFIVAGPPGLVVAPGRTCAHLVHAMDIWSTVADVLFIPDALRAPGVTIDSRSFLPHLRSTTSAPTNLYDMAHTFEPNAPSGTPRTKDYRGIRDIEGWSYIRLFSNDILAERFYYLPDDPREENDLLLGTLTTEQQDALDRLRDEMDDILDGWS